MASPGRLRQRDFGAFCGIALTPIGARVGLVEHMLDEGSVALTLAQLRSLCDRLGIDRKGLKTKSHHVEAIVKHVHGDKSDDVRRRLLERALQSSQTHQDKVKEEIGNNPLFLSERFLPTRKSDFGKRFGHERGRPFADSSQAASGVARAPSFCSHEQGHQHFGCFRIFVSHRLALGLEVLKELTPESAQDFKDMHDVSEKHRAEVCARRIGKRPRARDTDDDDEDARSEVNAEDEVVEDDEGGQPPPAVVPSPPPALAASPPLVPPPPSSSSDSSSSSSSSAPSPKAKGKAVVEKRHSGHQLV